MLSFIGSVPSIQAAQGQYIEVEQKFTSDIDLSGQTVRLITGLFLSKKNKSLPLGYTFERIYTTGEMSYKDKANRNWKADLTVIDNYNFKIKLGFLMVQDQFEWSVLTKYNNATVFDTEPASDSVYRTDKDIGMLIQVGNEKITHKIPITANSFFNNFDNWSFRSSSKTVKGFEAGQDLEVTYTGRTDIGNNYYAGLIRIDQVTGAGHFTDDYSLKYAFIDNTTNAVGGLDSTGITALQTFNNGIGKFTIGGANLKAGGVYKVFIAYQLKGIWVSQLSDELSEATPQNAITIGTTTAKIVDQFGGVETASCASGLAPCGTVQVRLEIDKTTYNSAATSNGLTGTIDDYFIQMEAFVVNTLPQNLDENSTLGDPVLLNLQANNTTYIGVVDVEVPDNFSGSKFVVIKALFDLGDYTDTVVQVFQLVYDVNLNPLAYTLKDPDGATTDIICSDSTFASSGDYSAEFAGVGTYKAFASVNGGECVESDIISSESAGAIGIDVDEISTDAQVCIHILEDGSSSSDTCQDCDDLHAFVQIAVSDNPELMTVDIITNKEVDMDILIVNQEKSSIYHEYTPTSEDQFQQSFTIEAGPNKWGFFVKFTDSNCTYSIRGLVLAIDSNNGPYAASQKLKIVANENPCGLNDAATVCDNTTNLVWSCNPVTHAITISWNDSFVDTSSVSWSWIINFCPLIIGTK